MFSLKAILVGVPEREAAVIRGELASRATPVEAEVVSAAEAVSRFVAPGAPPRMLIVDVRSEPDAGSVRLLRSAFPGMPLLALANSAGTAAAMIAINRAGADQVVGVPITEEDLAEALDRLALKTQRTSRSPILVVVSGTITGTGASTVAANLADELSHRYHVPTILVEARLQMGVQAINLNVHPRVTLADIVTDPESIDAEQVRKALIPVSPGFELIAAPQDLVHSGPNAVQGVLRALEICKGFAGVVVADAACFYDDLHFEVLWAADQVVLVADQSIPALRATKMILDAVNRAKAVKAVHVVLNRYDPEIPAMTVSKIGQTLAISGIRTVPNDYAHVMQAASEGVTLRTLAPDSPVVSAFNSLAGAIVGRTATPRDSNLFDRLLGSKKRIGGF